jgi:hypothetical protein
MLAALRKEPKFSELFVTYLVTRSNRTEEDLIDQLFNSSEKRLARLLLLANFGNGKPTPIDASISNFGGDDWNDPPSGELFPESGPRGTKNAISAIHPRADID